MIDLKIDEKGDVYNPSGEYLCQASELPEIIGCRSPDQEEEPQRYESEMGSSELLLRRSTTFELPENKKAIENGLWSLFKCGIHQTMSNVSSEKQEKRCKELLHSSILTALLDQNVSAQMGISDYIQLHAYGENLIARAATHSGDRLREATIMGKNLDPGVIDAIKYNPEAPKSGGYFSAFKKGR